MDNPWDINAFHRHNQVIEGKDLTFSKLMAPSFVKILSEIPDINRKSLIEIGCGTGILTHIVSGLVSIVVGIDSSQKACAIAEKFTEKDENVIIDNDNIECLNNHYQNNFDVALAHMVFHTVEDLTKALANIALYLRSDGYLIFSIPHPCFFSFYKAEISKNGYNYIVPSRHNISFTVSNDPTPLPEQVPYFHRPLSVYFDLLHACGFYTENILEPFPGIELISEYTSVWDYPRYMIFICKKNNRG